MSARGNHAVVIASHRQNRCGILPVGVVELIVIILGFAEAVDDVPQEKIELRNFVRVSLLVSAFVEVAQHLVDDLVLCDFGPRVLPQSPVEWEDDFLPALW